MPEFDYILIDLDVRLIVTLLLDFLEQFTEPLISSKNIILIWDFMTKESPDFVVIFQNEEINNSMDKHEFYIMNEFVKLANFIFKSNSEMKMIKNFFLRVSLSLLNKRKQFSSNFKEESLLLEQEQLDLFNKDEILKKMRQIFWLWLEEIRTAGKNQIVEIEESYKGVSSPLLVKKKHMNMDSRLRSKTDFIKNKILGLKPVEDDEKEESKN